MQIGVIRAGRPVVLAVVSALLLAPASSAFADDEEATDAEPQGASTPVKVVERVKVKVKGGQGNGDLVTLYIPKSPDPKVHSGRLTARLVVKNEHDQKVELRVTLKREGHESPDPGQFLDLDPNTSVDNSLTWEDVSFGSTAKLYLTLGTENPAAVVTGVVSVTISG